MLRRHWLLGILAMPAGALLAQSEGRIQDDNLRVRWNRFAHDGNVFKGKFERGEIDVRLAHKLSREWRDVEDSGEWPK